MPRTRVSGPWTPVMSFTITSIFFISHHADEVFFSRWIFLFARLEAPLAVARTRVELRQTEPLRDHAGNPVVDFGDLDFCRARRVHARRLGARVDTNLPRTCSLRLVLLRAGPSALHGASRHLFLLDASAASSTVVVSPCALRASPIAEPVAVGVVFFSSTGVGD